MKFEGEKKKQEIKTNISFTVVHLKIVRFFFSSFVSVVACASFFRWILNVKSPLVTKCSFQIDFEQIVFFMSRSAVVVVVFVMCLKENVLICNKNSIQSECARISLLLFYCTYLSLSILLVFLLLCQMAHTTNHRVHFVIRFISFFFALSQT